MRQEATNTFSEGIMTDLNELATPSKVLTDALNATLTTYNGNEFALQNDVGNARIGTSYLPTGYVPVGMKEYGGIIYVASWNPETKKGQIGCFPSPLHLYAGEDDNIAEITLDLNLFLKFETGLSKEGSDLFIHTDFIRTPIFQTKGTSEYREFHPGDKFILTTKEIPKAIKTAINAGVLVLKLAVVSNDGTISYVDDSTLSTYPNNMWIYERKEDESIESVLKEPSNIQVYGGSKAGRMLLIAEYSIYSDFDVYWKHTLDSNGNITTTFTGESIVRDGVKHTHVNTSTSESGETLSEPETKTNTFVGKLSHEKNVSNEYPATSYINLEEGSNVVSVDKNDIYSYEIYPSSYFGILGNLGMKGEINYPLLMLNNMLIGSWSLFVGDSNLVIDWLFDYFSLEDKQIKNIEFTFYPIEIISNLGDTYDIEKLNSYKESVYTLSLVKEHYSGSFTEHISFNAKFVKNHIYVCRIDCNYTNESSDILGFKFVYTNIFFNNVSSETLEEWSNARPVVQIPIIVNTEYDIEKQSAETVTTTKSYEDETEESSTVSALDFKLEEIIKSQPETGEKYVVTSLKEATYNIELDPQVTYSSTTIFNDRMFTVGDFPGDIDAKPLVDYITSTSLNKGTSDDSISGGGLDTLKDYLNKKEPVITTEKSGKYTILIYRGISADVVDTYSTMLELERLSPIYEPDRVENGKLFNFNRDNTGKLTLLGGDEEGIWQGKVISGDGSHILSGTGPGGNGTHADYLNVLNLSGGGVVSLLCGVDGDDASFRINPFTGAGDRDINYHIVDTGTTINYAHHWDSGEVDSGENFIMVGWQDSLGDHTLINMGSRKNEKSSSLPSGYIRRLRIDNILMCILSQLLIAKILHVQVSFLAPNQQDVLYHNSFNTNFKVEHTINTKVKDLNFFIGALTVEGCISKWLAYLNGGNHTLQNYLPKFEATHSDNTTLEFSLGSDIDITRMVSVYISASTSTPNFGFDKYLTPELRSKIYRGKVTAIDKNGLCTLDGNYLEGLTVVENDKLNELAFWVDDIRVYHAKDTGYNGKKVSYVDSSGMVNKSYVYDSNTFKDWADSPVSGNNIHKIHLRGVYDGTWHPKYRRDINDMFITAAANDGITASPIPSNYFNTIYVRGDIPTLTTVWVKNGDGYGPKIRTGVYFANVLKLTENLEATYYDIFN